MHRPKRRTVRVEAGPSVQGALPATRIRQRAKDCNGQRRPSGTARAAADAWLRAYDEGGPGFAWFRGACAVSPEFREDDPLHLCGGENANRRFEAKQSDHISVGLKIKRVGAPLCCVWSVWLVRLSWDSWVEKHGTTHVRGADSCSGRRGLHRPARGRQPPRTIAPATSRRRAGNAP